MSFANQRWHFKLLLAFLTLLPALADAQIIDPQNVLLRNVYLIEGGEGTKDVLVNVLITDNKLEAVSKDEIPANEAAMVVDARNGFLLGQLTVGETPSFIILNQDPRDSFETLLDTDAFTIFAIHDGRLFRNNLFEVPEEERIEEEKKKKTGWLAYTPPPMILPLSYGDSSRWNQWETKNTTGMFLGAVVLDRQHWLSQDSASETQVGDLSLFDGGEIRGLRVGVIGTLNFDRPWVYTIFGATHAFDKGFETENLDEFTFFDYRLDIPLTDKINLSVGKQKEPMSMERSMSMLQLPMQERTAGSDALMPSRNVGVVVSGGTDNQKMTWAGGVFNDWIDSGSSFGNSASQAIGRVTWLPMISEDESNLLHVGVGMRYTNAKEGVQYLTEPEFNKSPLFVDTGPITADDAYTYNLEASWRKGPIWISSEYTRTDVSSASSGDPNFNSFYVAGSWILTGEMRAYNKKSGILGPIPVAKSVYQGGKGAWELTARWSTVDLTDGLIDGGDMDILSLGANWWLTPFFNFNLNYRYITLDRMGINGHSSGLMGRLTLMLE
jgi:phosphate-selective porin OprO/OprP